MKRLFLIYILLFIFNHLSTAQVDHDDELPREPFSIENCVSEFNMDETVVTKVGYQFWFVDKEFLDGRTLKMSVVKPGEATHPPHQHLEDEFFFILEGTAEFYLDGKTKSASQYASFYCPSNSMHGIRNVGNTELKYLVIKKYRLNGDD